MYLNEEVTCANSIKSSLHSSFENVSVGLTQTEAIEENNNQVIVSKSALLDHTYSCKSPRRLKRQLEEVVDKTESMKKKLKTCRFQNSRLHDKVDSLTSVV